MTANELNSCISKNICFMFKNIITGLLVNSKTDNQKLEHGGKKFRDAKLAETDISV